ncbi:MAG: hypothetical protein WBA74_18710, partial [Cyclobacteriaceae bacterium]
IPIYLSILKQSPSNRQIAKTHHNMAVAYKNLDKKKAEQFFLKAYKLKKKLGSKQLLFNTVKDLAEFYLRNDGTVPAKPYLDEALSLYKDLPPIPDNYEVLFTGYKVLADLRNQASADDLLLRYKAATESFIQQKTTQSQIFNRFLANEITLNTNKEFRFLQQSIAFLSDINRLTVWVIVLACWIGYFLIKWMIRRQNEKLLESEIKEAFLDVSRGSKRLIKNK